MRRLPDAGGGSGLRRFYNRFVSEFRRFVPVQQEAGKAAQAFIDFPPMQAGASLHMAGVKAQTAAHAVGK